jgi:hypothetical protein
MEWRMGWSWDSQSNVACFHLLFYLDLPREDTWSSGDDSCQHKHQIRSTPDQISQGPLPQACSLLLLCFLCYQLVQILWDGSSQQNVLLRGVCGST